MSKKFFSSDWHLYHHNIIKYVSRPFKTARDMNESIIQKHNNVVGKEDEFWLLGDLCVAPPEFAVKVSKILNRMNGNKHIVLGNHDDWRAQSYIKAGFMSAHTASWFEHSGFKFYMMHDPAEYVIIENDPKAILLCGHVHNLFRDLLPDKRVINVGLDMWDYKPVSLEQILTLLFDANV